MRSSGKTVLVSAASLLGTAAVLAFAIPALAEKAVMSDHHKAHMEAVDTDGDGKISKAEAEAARDELFKSADADGNGSVNFDEFLVMEEKRRQMKLKRRFERSDKNGDGTLSSDEIGARRDSHFARMDRDGDGEISEEERKEAHKRMGRHHWRGHGRHGAEGNGPDED